MREQSENNIRGVMHLIQRKEYFEISMVNIWLHYMARAESKGNIT